MRAPPTVSVPPPRGWFALGFSDELAPGALAPRVLAGEELALFRTASGALGALGAHCPHLGAHLAQGGRVVGECVRCPFHGLEFDRSGACTATPYGRRLPKARAQAVSVCERHGVMLAWHDPDGQPPSFEVPALDMAGRTPFHRHRFSLRGHPQETSENGVDIGHLSVVHGYRRVETVRAARADGAYLNARYRMARPVGVGPLRPLVGYEFEAHLHGLGYSFVEVTTALGLDFRLLVLSTPTEPGRIDLRIASAAREPAGRWSAGLDAPTRVLARAANRGFFAAYRHDVEQDFRIWLHKRYVPRPALAVGDGPVGFYRGWASQFYGTASEPGAQASAEP